MSGSFLYSSDDVRDAELSCSCKTVQECRLGSEAGLSAGTSLAQFTKIYTIPLESRAMNVCDA